MVEHRPILHKEGAGLARSRCARHHNMSTLVDATGTDGRSAERPEVNHCAILPEEGVQFSRGGRALADDLSAIINRLGCAIGSAQRAKVNDRALHGGSCSSWKWQKCHNNRRNHSSDNEWSMQVRPKCATRSS